MQSTNMMFYTFDVDIFAKNVIFQQPLSRDLTVY